MKSLEVTLFLNQTPADGVASVCFQELYKARLMPAASKADGFASVFKNVFN